MTNQNPISGAGAAWLSICPARERWVLNALQADRQFGQEDRQGAAQ